MQIIKGLLASLVLCGLIQPAWSDGVACELQTGCVGRLRIGDSRAAVEKLIGRKVALQFAGDGRAGLTLDKRNDIRRLGFSLPLQISATATDIFFVTQPSMAVVEMISLAIPCTDVQRLRQEAESVGVPTVANPKGGWRVDEQQSRQKFIWGADSQPVCRLWIRAARPIGTS